MPGQDNLGAVDPTKKQSIYAKYATDSATSANFLNLCALYLYSDYIFEFLVGEYKKSPTKSKLIALFEVFCGPPGEGEGDPPMPLNGEEGITKMILVSDLDKTPHTLRDEEKDRGYTTLLKLYQTYKSLRNNSAEMNIFKRIYTSKERIPPANIFDHLIPHIFRQEEKGTMEPLVKRVQGAKIPNVIESNEGEGDAKFITFTKTWLPARKKLITAGFGALSRTWSSLRVVRIVPKPQQPRQQVKKPQPQEEVKAVPPSSPVQPPQPVAKKPIVMKSIATKDVPVTPLREKKE